MRNQTFLKLLKHCQFPLFVMILIRALDFQLETILGLKSVFRINKQHPPTLWISFLYRVFGKAIPSPDGKKSSGMDRHSQLPILRRCCSELVLSPK